MKRGITAAGAIVALSLTAVLPVSGAAAGDYQEIQTYMGDGETAEAEGEIYGQVYRTTMPTEPTEPTKPGETTGNNKRPGSGSSVNDGGSVTTPQTRDETKAAETAVDESRESASQHESGSQAGEQNTSRPAPANRRETDRVTTENVPAESGEIQEDGSVYWNGQRIYRADPDKRELLIAPAAFHMALQEERDLVIYLEDLDGGWGYRLRYSLEDLKRALPEEMTEVFFEFGKSCRHEKQADRIVKGAKGDGVALFLCEHKTSGPPVYVGVRVPEHWDSTYGVYVYGYDDKTGEFVLTDNPLTIDGERMAEVYMNPPTDVVFTQLESIPFEMNTWVQGIAEGNSQVDRGRALLGIALAVFGGGTVTLGGFLTGIRTWKAFNRRR